MAYDYETEHTFYHIKLERDEDMVRVQISNGPMEIDLMLHVNDAKKLGKYLYDEDGNL